jgi:hypothetical protein
MLVSCCALAIPTSGARKRTTAAIAVRTIIMIIISSADKRDGGRFIVSRTLYTSQSEIRLWIIILYWLKLIPPVWVSRFKESTTSVLHYHLTLDSK